MKWLSALSATDLYRRVFCKGTPTVRYRWRIAWRRHLRRTMY